MHWIGVEYQDYLKLKLRSNIGDNMPDTKEERAYERRKRLPYWGVILILIGVFALLVNLNIITGLNWSIFWPVLLIVLGILALYEYYMR
jgi:hypothetical protein